ncbi:MAG: ABC transporter permease [Candidatus Bathyarchaeota archaeon]|nr:ABC transporter permease [Candidatus Bathyarchaeota archaeon]
MNILDFAAMSVEGISERKLRFSLNLIGIIIGCAAVTGIISMTGGMRTSIVDDISIFGTNTIQVFPVAGGDEAFNVLDWRDLSKLRNIPGVEAAAPVMAGSYVTYDYRGEVQRNQVAGVDTNYFIVHGGENELEDGRLFENSDYGVALLGSNVWNVDDEQRYSVGDRIRLTSVVNGETLEYSVRIIGIIKLTSGIATTGIDDLIIIPLSYYEQIYDMNGKYVAIDLKAETLEDVTGIKQYIDEEFDDIGYYSMDMIMEEVDQLIGTINAVLGGIAAISLIVAGVTIINTMTISVMERTREIGVMKAIGATNKDVLFLFISESMVTGLVGGGLGAGVGFLLSTVIGGYIGLPPQITFDLGITVTFFAIITCVISGVYPAWRASNLNPVEALRDE